MAVISNSSPLILYAKIRRLEILREVFGEVLIPPSVYDEIATQGAGRPGAGVVAAAPWITRRALTDSKVAQALLAELDQGEAEAIALTVELGRHAAILVDDRKGRRLARERSLRVVGSAGALVLAKERGVIASVRPVLDELRSAGLHLSDAAYHEVLALANELGTNDEPRS